MNLSVIIWKRQTYFGNGSGWITDLIIDHTIDISNNKPLRDSNHVKLLKIVRPSN